MKKLFILLLTLFLFTNPSFAKTQETREIQFIYINGSNNNDLKMKNWFYNGVEKMHPNMYKAFSTSPFINEKLFNNGEFKLSESAETFFWGDKSKIEIENINTDLAITKIFSPKIAQSVRKLLANCLHDAIWVSHYRNMHPIIQDLHKQVIENYKKNKTVVLLGYSAGAFVTYEYLFNKFAGIDANEYIEKQTSSKKIIEYTKNNPKQKTCIDALVESKIAIYNAENNLIPNSNDNILIEGYKKLDDYTCEFCIPDGAVKGLINFASPLVLFYSDVSNPNYPLTDYNKLLYKHMLENDIFWLTVNYAEDPLGYPTTKNLTYKDLKDKINLEITPKEGFLYSKSNLKTSRTFIGAHTSYWATSKKFSKGVVQAYEEGYKLYNK